MILMLLLLMMMPLMMLKHNQLRLFSSDHTDHRYMFCIGAAATDFADNDASTQMLTLSHCVDVFIMEMLIPSLILVMSMTFLILIM